MSRPLRYLVIETTLLKWLQFASDDISRTGSDFKRDKTGKISRNQRRRKRAKNAIESIRVRVAMSRQMAPNSKEVRKTDTFDPPFSSSLFFFDPKLISPKLSKAFSKQSQKGKK